jgi:hypothetical protein
LFWSLTVNGLIPRSDRAATLEEAKAQFQKSWNAWKAWTKLKRCRNALKLRTGGYPAQNAGGVPVTDAQCFISLSVNVSV